MPPNDAHRKYFAARKKTDIGKAIIGKLEDMCADESASMREEYANAYDHLYGVDNGSGLGITSGILRGGEQGEKTIVRTNRAGAYGNAFEAMAMGPKLTWRPQARNGDAGAARATSLAFNLLEDEWKTQRLAHYARRWGQQAFRFSEAWMFPEWDLGRGPVVGLKQDEYSGERVPVLGGEITYHNILPWHVFRDTSARKHEDNTWRVFRIWKNRFDLLALYPRLVDGQQSADKLLGGTPKLNLWGHKAEDDDSDFIPVYYFFHDKTPALPLGRQVILVGPEAVLSDSKLLYPEAPAYRIAAADMHDTPFAWSPWWDTLGLQELTDAVESDIASNISTFANQLIAREKGSDVTADSITGHKFIDVPKGGMVPQGVNLVKNPPEVFAYVKDKAADQKQLVGLNDVALGQPQTAQMNAEAFAILASMAVQQASPYQSAWVEGVAALGGGVLKIKSRFVTRERKLQITGKANQNLFSEEEYTGKELAPVEKVIVDIGSPLEQTPAGRAMLLEKHMAVPGAITSPEQITQVLETGRLEPATRGVRNELLLINAEFEQLTEGLNPPVHYGQNHALHFRNNMAALHSPEALGNRAIIIAVEAHCDEHYLHQFGIPRALDPLRTQRERWMMGHPLSPDQQAAMMAPPMMMPGAPMPGGPMPGDPMAAGGPPPGAEGGPSLEGFVPTNATPAPMPGEPSQTAGAGPLPPSLVA